MEFKIKHHATSKVLFSFETESLKLAIEAAIKAKANLRGADLWGASLRGASLWGANLNQMVLETGESFETYLKEVVPALIASGGHPVAKEAWSCHSWKNCPMAVAFGVKRLEDIPVLYRPRVEQFIRYFDARLIPEPSYD